MDLQLLRQVDDKWQTLERIFINCPHWIVDEVWAQKQSQEEYSSIMILVFIECTDTLRVNDQYLESSIRLLVL